MRMEVARRDFAALATALLLISRPITVYASNEQRRVLIVTSSFGEAYGEALEGLGSVLKDCLLTTIDLSDPASSRQLDATVNAPGLHAIVSVGTTALAAVAAQPSEVPLVATMILRGDAGRAPSAMAGRRNAAAVTLDVSLEQVLRHLQRVMPGHTRLGIIRGPHNGGPAQSSLQAEAKRAGFSVDVRECSRADELLKVFLSFHNQVDFVWCPPDGSLFNGATVKTLVLASVRDGLPIIGFSENFVRAGAALGVYPDYQDVGRQTGDLVRRVMEGRTSTLGSEIPENVRVAVNQRVLRILGLRFSPPAQLDSRFLVLR